MSAFGQKQTLAQCLIWSDFKPLSSLSIQDRQKKVKNTFECINFIWQTSLMGSDACISMFEQKRWDEVLIPAAIGLISGHGMPDWARAALKDRHWDVGDLEFPEVKSFKTDCSIMADLATIDAGLYSRKLTESKPRKFWGVSSDRRRCRDKECRSRSRCPFFLKDKIVEWESTSIALSEMVDAILNPELKDEFMGRRASTNNFRELLDDWNVPQNASVRDLLDRLGSRGFIIGYQFMGSGEGIHGWLTTEECLSLATELRKLDIPKFEATKDELKKMRPLGVEFKKLYREAEYKFEVRERQWRVLTLAYLCAFAEYAALTNMGLIWINY